MGQTVAILKTIEGALVLTVCIVIGYIAFALFLKKDQLRIPNEVYHAAVPAAEGQEPSTLQSLKPYSFYAEELEKKDIFGFVAPGSVKGAGAKGPESAKVELPSNFKIVGVIVGHPSEVIIEDTQAKETFFLQEGKQLGDFEIEHAEKEKVALKYQGKSFNVDLKK